MDQKFKFSPSNIERCEAAFRLQHDQAMGYRPPPFARNVKAKTAWEELRYAFPAPIDIKCQMHVKQEVDYYEAIKDENKCMWTAPAAVHALSVLNKPDEYEAYS